MNSPRARALASALLLLGWALLGPAPARAQESQAEETVAPSAVDDTADAAEADGDPPRRKFIRFNEYQGPYFSVRFGFGLLFDGVTYLQDDISKTQMGLEPEIKLRDFRFLFKGKLFTPRLGYTIGYMFDAQEEKWRFRQTGLMLDIPEVYGRLFVGRTKEGTSTNKIMVGYQGFTMERATANDAFVPILADGVKWMGTSPGNKLVYSVGWFGDMLSEKESFNKFDMQVVGRLIWLPFPKTLDTELLHVGMSYRVAKSNNGFFRFKSKPESFAAQVNAIDTGDIAGDWSNLFEPEMYYRNGPFLLGIEYFFQQVDATTGPNPFFHGGELVIAEIVTGETRPYNRKGAYFDRISPLHPVFSHGPSGWKGGWGAWEIVARISYTDLDSAGIEGGKFWRFTPMVNWHLTDNIRQEFSYGYGILDRFGVSGGTHFFATRLQFQL